MTRWEILLEKPAPLKPASINDVFSNFRFRSEEYKQAISALVKDDVVLPAKFLIDKAYVRGCILGGNHIRPFLGWQ